jgi:hypothetical protein
MNEEEKKNKEAAVESATQVTKSSPQDGDNEDRSVTGFFRARYPDVSEDDEAALYDRISEDYRNADLDRENMKKFNELLTQDERIAGLITGMASGKKGDGSPFSIAEYLLENYGDDIYSSTDPKEAAKKAAEREAAMQAESRAKAEMDEARKKNFEACDKAFEEAVKSLNINDTEAEKFLDWIYNPDNGFIHRVWTYDVGKEDWVKLLQAYNYDNAVTKAEENGYKRGRNEKIDMARHRESSRRNMPSDLSNSGASLDEGEKDPTLTAYSKMKRRIV